MQISQGMGDPGIVDMARLRLVVRGMKKELVGQPKKTRLPIALTILRQIRKKLEVHDTEWDYRWPGAYASSVFCGRGR